MTSISWTLGSQCLLIEVLFGTYFVVVSSWSQWLQVRKSLSVHWWKQVESYWSGFQCTHRIGLLFSCRDRSALFGKCLTGTVGFSQSQPFSHHWCQHSTMRGRSVPLSTGSWNRKLKPGGSCSLLLHQPLFLCNFPCNRWKESKQFLRMSLCIWYSEPREPKRGTSCWHKIRISAWTHLWLLLCAGSFQFHFCGWNLKAQCW